MDECGMFLPSFETTASRLHRSRRRQRLDPHRDDGREGKETMSALRRRRRVRLHPYVDVEIAQQLALRCAASGATVGAVVQAALEEHLERTGVLTDIMTRLERIGRRVERTHRDLELFMEAFGVWVKIWFAHNPRIHADDLDLVRREAESRFAEFVEDVAQEYSSGHHFLEELGGAVLARRADDSAAVAQGAPAIRGDSRDRRVRTPT
jgi:hypothetical protein